MSPLVACGWFGKNPPMPLEEYIDTREPAAKRRQRRLYGEALCQAWQLQRLSVRIPRDHILSRLNLMQCFNNKEKAFKIASPGTLRHWQMRCFAHWPKHCQRRTQAFKSTVIYESTTARWPYHEVGRKGQNRIQLGQKVARINTGDSHFIYVNEYGWITTY